MHENNLNTQYPLVSIIITSYNRADLIGKTIMSAMNQDYPNLEIIISDNCSTDATDTVIQKYLQDPRIKYTRNDTNIGMIPNFKRATYDLAAGKYITYVSSDDSLIDPFFISDGIRLIKKHEKVVLVFARMRFVTDDGTILRDSPEYPYFLKEIWSGKELFFEGPSHGIFSWGGCIMIREDLIKIKALQKEYVTSDVDTNYKIMLNGNVAFLNRVSYKVLTHPNNASDRVNASEKILHLECLNGIADNAKNVMPDETQRIDEWAHYFIYAHGYNTMKLLRSKNQKEYKAFKTYFQRNYPAVYNEIISKWKFRVYIWMYSLKNIFK